MSLGGYIEGLDLRLRVEQLSAGRSPLSHSLQGVQTRQYRGAYSIAKRPKLQSILLLRIHTIHTI